MAILSVVTDSAGLANVNPRIVKINSNDTLATILTSGYLNNAQSEGFTINPTDLILISYSNGNGIFTASISGNTVTLYPLISSLSSSGLVLESYLDNVVAHSGGGQANATTLTAMANRITTVAAGNDSVMLPSAKPGIHNLVVVNAGANSANIFPAQSEQINALGVNNAYALAAGKCVSFTCINVAQWFANLSA